MACSSQFGKFRRAFHGRNVTVFRTVARVDLLQVVVDHVHPANFRALPPSPVEIAYKGEAIGLGAAGDFFREAVTYRAGEAMFVPEID